MRTTPSLLPALAFALVASLALQAPAAAQDEPAGPTGDAAADAAAALPPDTLDFSGLVAPFDQGFTAATSFESDGLIVFHVDDSLLYAPASAAAVPGVGLSRRIDAALRYDTDTLMLFSDAETFLVDIGTAAVTPGSTLAELGLPADWDRLDAAAVFADRQWILFRGGEFVVVDLPSEDAPLRVADPEPLTRLSLGDWTDGIDAAANLLDGRLVFFRGNGFVVLDLAANTITAPAAFASTAVAAREAPATPEE